VNVRPQWQQDMTIVLGSQYFSPSTYDFPISTTLYGAYYSSNNNLGGYQADVLFHEYMHLATGKTDSQLANWIQGKGGDFSKWEDEFQVGKLGASAILGRWVAEGCPKR